MEQHQYSWLEEIFWGNLSISQNSLRKRGRSFTSRRSFKERPSSNPLEELCEKIFVCKRHSIWSDNWILQRDSWLHFLTFRGWRRKRHFPIKIPKRDCQVVYAFFLFRRSTRLCTRRLAYILTLSTAPLVSSKNSGAMVTLGGVCFSPAFSL